MDIEIVSFTPQKLKHLASKEVYYQLVNTCLIISLVGWRYCNYWKFSGCRARPSHRNLRGDDI